MFKCVVIDDEQPAINVLVRYIEHINYLNLVGTATDPLKGIDLIKKNNADVVFLDIEMDEMNGIKVMNILDPSVKVIFCTAYSGDAIKNYSLNALDYLTKPISFERFKMAIKKLKAIL